MQGMNSHLNLVTKDKGLIADSRMSGDYDSIILCMKILLNIKDEQKEK